MGEAESGETGRTETHFQPHQEMANDCLLEQEQRHKTPCEAGKWHPKCPKWVAKWRQESCPLYLAASYGVAKTAGISPPRLPVDVGKYAV